MVLSNGFLNPLDFSVKLLGALLAHLSVSRLFA